MKSDKDNVTPYPITQAVSKLRRLADCLEQGRPFHIHLRGDRVRIPVLAEFSIEHETEGDTEELEFQFTWKRL